MDNYYKKANVEGKIVGYLPNGLIEVDYAGTPLVVMESENEYKYDRSGNLIGDGGWHVDYIVYDFPEYPQISSSVTKSNTSESVYVTYYNSENGNQKTVRFSNHENNAVRFGDQLNGYSAIKPEILVHLGIGKRIFIPETYLYIHKTQVKNSNAPTYEEAHKTIQEMYSMGEGADLSMYKGKLAKGSRWLILGDKVERLENKKRNYLGQEVTVGKYVYEIAKGGLETDSLSKGIELYHAGRVEAIGDNRLINELGIHLGSKETADKIGELKGVETKKYKVDIKNPIELPDFPRWEAFVVSRKLKDMGILTENEFEEIRKETGNEKEKLLLQLLKKKGYDGFVYENAFEGGGKSYVAFDKKQVTEYAQGGSLIPEKYRRLGFTAVGKKEKSYLPKKKWMVLAKKGDHYKVVHGGYTGMEDFSEHKDTERRKRFWQRMGGYSKDPFSALYWHKKFGTWEDGGSLAETMQTVRDLAEYDASNPGVLTGTFFSLLKLNDIFRIGQRTYQVTRLTPLKDYSPPFTGKRNISIKEQETGKKITGVYLQKKSGSGLWFSSSSSRKSDPWGQLSRNIEGDIIVDLLNENNNFHAFSDAYKMLAAFITQRTQGSPNTETMQTTTKAQSIEEAFLFLDDREKKELIKAVQEDVSVLEQAAAILYNDEAKWQEADTLQAEIDALQAILNKHNVCETGQVEKSRSRVVDGKYEFATETVVQAFDSAAQLKRYFEKIPISDKSMHSAASAADAGLSFAVPIWHRDSQGRKLWFEYKQGEECPFILRTIDQQTKTVNDQIVMRDWPISVFWPKGVRKIFLDPIFDKVKNHIAHKFLKKDRLFRLTNKNLHEATAAEMYELLFFGHPTEWGLNVSRHAMLTEWERRGEQMTEELGLPTDLDYPYINKHTGPGSIEPLFCQSILLDIYKDATSYNGDCESRIKELKDFYDRAIAEEAKEPLANGRSAQIEWWSVHEHWMPVADIDGAIAFVNQKKAENLALPAPKLITHTNGQYFDRFEDENYNASICALEHWRSKCKQEDNCL